MQFELSRLESPLGSLVIAVANGSLYAVELSGNEALVRSWIKRAYPQAEFLDSERGNEVTKRLCAYFEGDLRALEDITVVTTGTPFQKQVWEALRRIPLGKTASYRDVAVEIGRPEAVRAVGAANGHNPIAVVVPCHRVIASDGTLCGYGGGLWRKKWLLQHEGALAR